MEQPQGYEVLGQENKVYKLNKSLYRLKQTPRAWYSRINYYLIHNDFQRSECEPTLHIKVIKQGNIPIICLYVDDLIFTGDYSIEELRLVMESEFEMTYLGIVRDFLAIEVHQTKYVMFI